MPESRDNSGRFVKGVSGNPGGQRKTAVEFKERCRDFMSEKGFQSLIDMASNPKDRDRFKAIELIAGYGLGKPKQGVELTGEDGDVINIVVRAAEPRDIN